MAEKLIVDFLFFCSRLRIKVNAAKLDIACTQIMADKHPAVLRRKVNASQLDIACTQTMADKHPAVLRRKVNVAQLDIAAVQQHGRQTPHASNSIVYVKDQPTNSAAVWSFPGTVDS